MNGRFGAFVREHWWKVVVGIFSMGALWQNVQGKITQHDDRLSRVEKDNQTCHDFMIAQAETNKEILRYCEKFDRVLSRR